MPTYNYECSDCNYKFEESFKKMDDVTSPCPKCSKPAARGVSMPNVLRGGTSRENGDMKIGAIAEKQWDKINKRKEERKRIRKESGNEALGISMKRENGEIKYQYSSVSKERIEERKKLYSDAQKAEVKISEGVNLPGEKKKT